MSDNVEVSGGVGVVIAADEIGSAKYQRVKVNHGIDGQTVDASHTDPLPVSAYPAADKISWGGFLYPIQNKVIDTATIGDQTIITAIGTSYFVVFSYDLVVAAAVALTWKSGATALSGAKSFAANGGICKPGPHPYLRTAPGAPLVLGLGAAVQTSGELTYITV